MRSTFYGLDIANRGLFVSQRQIDVTSHNVSNANTEGYSRQRFITSNVPPSYGRSQLAPTDVGFVGGGVETLSLDQIRDVFLDRQYRSENARASYYATKSEALYYVEDVFNSTTENRLDGLISNFFNSIQELSKNTTDKAVRTNVIQQTKKMTDELHSYYSHMEDLMYQMDSQLVAQTTVVNEITTKLAALNMNISRFELSGSTANDLRDARGLLLDELAGIVDITYEEVGIGVFDIRGKELTVVNVKVGDEYLVEQWDSREIYARQGETNAMVDNMPEQKVTPEKLLHAICFSDTGEELEITSGKIKGYMDIRDGNERENQGIPYFVQQLDILAQALVEAVNEVQRNGYSLPYTDDIGVFHPSMGPDEVPFFFDPSGLTAATISLSEEIMDDNLGGGFNIAASSVFVTMDSDGHLQTGNNVNALDLIKEVKERTDIPVIGSFEGYFKSFVAEMAAEISSVNQRDASEQVVLDNLDANRISIYGVSIDEEMTNLIRFQHAYNASARMITAMDEELDVLINRMGRVGL